MNYLIWLTISAVFFALGEYFSKRFALQPGPIFVVCLLAAYTVSVLLWLPAIMQKDQLSIVGTMWSVLSLLVTVLLGTVIFHEKLNLLGTIGIATAVISIILLAKA